MSMIQEFREWEATYDPTPPKSTKTYNKFFWWRRYQEHKSLPNPNKVMAKALNVDYD